MFICIRYGFQVKYILGYLVIFNRMLRHSNVSVFILVHTNCVRVTVLSFRPSDTGKTFFNSTRSEHSKKSLFTITMYDYFTNNTKLRMSLVFSNGFIFALIK